MAGTFSMGHCGRVLRSVPSLHHSMPGLSGHNSHTCPCLRGQQVALGWDRSESHPSLAIEGGWVSGTRGLTDSEVFSAVNRELG